MVRFEKDRLIIEVDTKGERTSDAYYKILDSLTEVIWFALMNDENSLIREDVGWLVWYLQKSLIGYEAPNHNRPDPADDQPR